MSILLVKGRYVITKGVAKMRRKRSPILLIQDAIAIMHVRVVTAKATKNSKKTIHDYDAFLASNSIYSNVTSFTKVSDDYTLSYYRCISPKSDLMFRHHTAEDYLQFA